MKNKPPTLDPVVVCLTLVRVLALDLVTGNILLGLPQDDEDDDVDDNVGQVQSPDIMEPLSVRNEATHGETPLLH